jgi:hypothetical protein
VPLPLCLSLNYACHCEISKYVTTYDLGHEMGCSISLSRSRGLRCGMDVERLHINKKFITKKKLDHDHISGRNVNVDSYLLLITGLLLTI